MTKRESGLTAPSPPRGGGTHKLLQPQHHSRGTPRSSGHVSILSPISMMSSSSKSNQKQHNGAIRRGGNTSALKATKRRSSMERLSSSTSTLTSPYDENTEEDDDKEEDEVTESVKVCVRIRPLLENDHGLAPRAYVVGDKNTIVKNLESSPDNNNCISRSYSFNHVYGETSTTRQLYDDMVADIVESVGCQGRNGTVFTYGQTSTGTWFQNNANAPPTCYYYFFAFRLCSARPSFLIHAKTRISLSLSL